MHGQMPAVHAATGYKSLSRERTGDEESHRSRVPRFRRNEAARRRGQAFSPGETIGHSDTMASTNPKERFTLRTLTEADLEDMLQVWLDAGLPCRPTGRDSLPELRTQFRDAPDLFIGAFSGEKMIGAVIATDDGRKGWINRLAVLPGYRRVGVGKALVKECEDALRKRGRGVFSILIEGENEASERLFMKEGYRDESDIRYYAKRDSEKI